MVHRRYAAMMVLMLALAGSVLLAVGCTSNNNDTFSNGWQPVGNPGANAIWIYQYHFTPETLTVASGTEVTFTNKDAFPHNITSGTPSHPDSLFDSGVLTQGMSFTHLFDQPGEFHYFCSTHPDSGRGLVIVN